MRIQLAIGKCLVMGGWADGHWHLVVGPWHSGSLRLGFGGPGSSSVQPQREQGKSSSQHPQPLAWLPRSRSRSQPSFQENLTATEEVQACEVSSPAPLAEPPSQAG